MSEYAMAAPSLGSLLGYQILRPPQQCHSSSHPETPRLTVLGEGTRLGEGTVPPSRQVPPFHQTGTGNRRGKRGKSVQTGDKSKAGR